jgi:hypothetical protein
MFERNWIPELSSNKTKRRSRLIAELRIKLSNMKPKIKGICKEKRKNTLHFKLKI